MVKATVSSAFRLRGLDLKLSVVLEIVAGDIFFSMVFSDASQFLVELASSVPSASLTSWLDQLIDLLTKRSRMYSLGNHCGRS